MTATLTLLLFTSITIVSTRNVHRITTSYKHVSEPNGDECKSSDVEPESINDWHDGDHENDNTEERIRAKQNVNLSHKKDNLNGPVYTNLNRHQYNINVKLIKKLDEGIDPDIIVFQDNTEEHRGRPFTNKRPENNTKYEVTVNTYVPTRKSTSSKLPDTGDNTKHLSTIYSTDKPRTTPTVIKVTVVTKPNGTSPNNTVHGHDTQGTTPPGFDLEDRVAFEGDKCATGKAKVQGKCVPTQE